MPTFTVPLGAPIGPVLPPSHSLHVYIPYEYKIVHVGPCGPFDTIADGASKDLVHWVSQGLEPVNVTVAGAGMRNEKDDAVGAAPLTYGLWVLLRKLTTPAATTPP